MDLTAALSEYDRLVPHSHRLLRGCIEKPIRQVVWHQIDGDDAYGHLLESLELKFAHSSLFLRTPRQERGDRLDVVEFVAEALDAETPNSEYRVATDTDEPKWRNAIASPISSVELLVDAKHEGIARYHGVRFQLRNGHALGYHYQWGSRIGDPIPRHAIVTIDGPDPPMHIGWSFVKWIPALA